MQADRDCLQSWKCYAKTYLKKSLLINLILFFDSAIDVAPNEIYWVKSKGEPTCDYGSTSSQLAIDCSQWVITMRCFSIRKNGAAILNLEDGSSGGSLAVIHGLRVITMAWIILGHTYGLVNPQIHSEFFWGTVPSPLDFPWASWDRDSLDSINVTLFNVSNLCPW